MFGNVKYNRSGTLDKLPTKAQTLPVPIVGYTLLAAVILIKMKKPTEVNFFYEECENKYNALLEEILQKDCQRVEFIRGMISVYKEILSSKKHWEDKEDTGFSYFK